MAGCVRSEFGRWRAGTHSSVCPHDVGRRSWVDHQYCIDVGHHSFVARRSLFSSQGSGDQPDVIPCSRVGDQRDSGQRDQPWLFPAEQNRKLLFNDDGSYTQRGGQIIGHTPMQRFGEAKELAGVVVWLASQQAASFVTGQNIAVDGGFASVTI